MKRIFAILLSLLLTVSLVTACGNQAELQDGYYTAQVSEFSHGWKEYITILVKGGSIVSVEYNAENASGFIKSWDNAYMQTMLHDERSAKQHGVPRLNIHLKGGVYFTLPNNKAYL